MKDRQLDGDWPRRILCAAVYVGALALALSAQAQAPADGADAGSPAQPERGAETPLDEAERDSEASEPVADQRQDEPASGGDAAPAEQQREVAGDSGKPDAPGQKREAASDSGEPGTHEQANASGQAGTETAGSEGAPTKAAGDSSETPAASTDSESAPQTEPAASAQGTPDATSRAPGPPASSPRLETVQPPRPRPRHVHRTVEQRPVEPLLEGPARFLVGLGLHHEWRSDRGYERFGDQADTRFHAVVGADAVRFEHYGLGVEASFDGGIEERPVTLAGEGQLRSQAFMAALVPRFAFTSWLWPHLRIGAGALRSRVQISQSALTARTAQDWTYAIDAAAGFSLGLPEGSLRTARGRLRTLTPLLRVEAGYRWAPDAHFGRDETNDSDAGSLTEERSGLGSLSRRAALLRVIAGARF